MWRALPAARSTFGWIDTADMSGRGGTVARCECSGGIYGGCGRVFSSSSAFDLHRAGDYGVIAGEKRRRCCTEEEMRARGLVVHPTKTDARGSVWVEARSLDTARGLRGFLAQRPRSGVQDDDAESIEDAAS